MTKRTRPHPSDFTPVDLASVLALFIALGVFNLGVSRSEPALLFTGVAISGLAAVTKIANSRAKARNEREDEERGEAGPREG